jgi:hypothetical protein
MELAPKDAVLDAHVRGLTPARRHWPVWTTILIYWAVVTVLLWASVRHNNGHFVYSLDDTYIHMAMAKNLAADHVWGITKHGFTSASSSPLWVLLLAAINATLGETVLTPFVLNVVLCTTLIAILCFVFTRADYPPWAVLWLGLGILFSATLPRLTFAGLEHPLQIVLVLLFALAAAKDLSTRENQRRARYSLLLLAPVMTFTRYEGFFVLAAVVLLLLIRRRVRFAALLALAGSLPALVYGLVSVAHGWYFVPNSLLVKGHNFVSPSLWQFERFLVYAYYQAGRNPHLVIIVIAMAFLLLIGKSKHETIWTRPRALILIYLVTLYFHLQFSLIDSHYDRYEAYLAVLGPLAIALEARQWLPQTFRLRDALRDWPARLGVVVFLFCISPFVVLSALSLSRVVRGTANIYEQQYQVANFLARFYDGRAVIMNDVGAINYYANLKSIDLVGLASMDVARAQFERRFDAGFISRIAAESRFSVAAIYARWYSLPPPSRIPPEWVEVARWKLSNNIVCGDTVVSFFAPDSSQAVLLYENLRAYSAALPASVRYVFVYEPPDSL